jgi:hypothetical protein
LFFTGLAVIISPSAFLSSVDGKYILNSDDYILNNGGDRFADGLKFPHSIVLGKFLSRGLRYLSKLFAARRGGGRSRRFSQVLRARTPALNSASYRAPIEQVSASPK